MNPPSTPTTHIPAASLGLVAPPADEGVEMETAIDSGASTPLREESAIGGREADGRAARIVLSGAWEQELIISGAVVFALMQLPSLVDGVFHRLEGRVSGAGWSMTMIGYEFSKLILYALISAFVVHLASRAYWVGLMGLHSVFPNGIQWDRARVGPIGRAVYERRFPTLPQSIAAADDFCSVIFSFAFMLVITFFATILWCVAAVGLVWSISALAYGGQWQQGIFMSLFMVLALVPAGLYTVDRRLGHRLRPDGWPRRLVQAGIVFFFYASFLRLAGPISQVLFTNLPRRRAYGMFFSVLAGLMVLFFVKDLMLGQGTGPGVGAASYLPDEDDPRGVDSQLYEDQRPEGAPVSLPSIPSDVVQGPYVRLFIPYVPRRHDPAVAARCPGVKPPAGTDAGDETAVRSVTACLARIQRVWLNGKPLTGVDFRFRTDPRTGARGIVGYVPTAGLPHGENLLQVEHSPRPPEAAELKLKLKPLPPYSIRFWI